MADAKAAKLAAARKKLKDHQEKKNLKTYPTEIGAHSVNEQHSVKVQDTNAQDVQNDVTEEIVKSDLPLEIVATTAHSYETVHNVIDRNSNETASVWTASVPSTTESQMHFQQQMHSHMMATEILISDKRNLEAKVHSLEESLRALGCKHAETVESFNFTKQSWSRLEAELRDSKEYVKMLRSELESMNYQMEKYRMNEEKMLQCKSELEEKLETARTALANRDTENTSLVSQLTQVQRELDITQLHLQQLTNGGGLPDSETNVDPKTLLEQNNSLQHFNARLEHEIKMVVSEKEQLATHYQHYIQKLNEELESEVLNKIQKQKEYEDLANRESSLVDQMGQMERRMQTLQEQIAILNKTDRPHTPDRTAEEMVELKLQYEATKAQLHLLEKDHQILKKNLADSEEKVTELTDTIQTLRHEQPDVTKLSAANESDRVAAQRATAQNAKLKEELKGLQDAFVIMSNDKLEFTEKLQAEKFLNRELTIKLSEAEEVLKQIQSKLIAKDEEMIRLQANCSKMEKELLQNSQEIDRLRHYEVTKSNDNMLQTELDFAQQTIAKLRHDIGNFQKKENNSTETRTENAIECPMNKTNSQESALENLQKETSSNCKQNVGTDTHLNIIPTEEAMMRLQQRFLKTMKEVAELSDEKQNLEHIVLQLQGETETICEYIALYQQQRGILKQREEERAAQMKYMAAERERMQTQLEELQRMITGGNADTSTPQASPNFQQEKVTEIVNLLSEIRHSHLIDPNKNCSGLENFHPCPWCSGKLINV